MAQKLRLLLPGDRVLTGAPAGQTLYVDARIGVDTNDGTTPAKAKRTLPFSAAAGAKIAIRADCHYYADSVGQRNIALNGAAGNTVDITFWPNNVDKPAIIGADTALTGWGAVVDAFGNSFLSANGQQVTLPLDATPWHTHYKGADMLTPAFWSPASPADLSTVCRWDFYSTYAGSECQFTSANLQSGGSGSAGVAVNRDTTLADTPLGDGTYDSVTWSITAGAGGTSITTIYYRHTAIGLHYGANSPVGAIVAMRTNPSNLPNSGVITAYNPAPGGDPAKSEIVVTMRQENVSGANMYRVAPYAEWWVLGHPADIKQGGQYGWLWNGGAPKGWKVNGSWMRGANTMATSDVAVRFTGSYVNMTGPHLIGRFVGRCSFGATPTEVLFAPTGRILDCALQIGALTNADLEGQQLGQAWDRDFGSLALSYLSGRSAITIRNFRTYQAFTLGGYRGIDGVQLDGGEAHETARTFSYGLPIRNVNCSHSYTVHGNGIAYYETTNNLLVEKCMFLERTLNITMQGENGAQQAIPRNLVYRQSMMTPARAIGLSTIGPRNPDFDIFRVDDSFQGCTIGPRFYAPESGRYSLYIGFDADTLSLGRHNDGGVVDRSVFNTLGFEATAGAAQNGGAAVDLRDVLAMQSTFGGTGPSGAQPWGAGYGGATVTRSVLDTNEPRFTGTLSDLQWEMMSRAAGGGGAGGAHEAFQIGPDAYDIQVPAWANTTPRPVGTPVDLKLSKPWFYINHQAGKVVACFVRARPLSTVTLISGYGNNALLDLDGANIFAKSKLSLAALGNVAQLAIGLRETTATGSTRDTFITLPAKR